MFACALDTQEQGGRRGRRHDASVRVRAHARRGRSDEEGEFGSGDARLSDGRADSSSYLCAFDCPPLDLAGHDPPRLSSQFVGDRRPITDESAFDGLDEGLVRPGLDSVCTRSVDTSKCESDRSANLKARSSHAATTSDQSCRRGSSARYRGSSSMTSTSRRPGAARDKTRLVRTEPLGIERSSEYPSMRMRTATAESRPMCSDSAATSI